MSRLKDKVAFVTGATRGIGEAIAIAMAREGAKVAVAGRTEKDGVRVAEAIKDTGGTAEFVRLDLSDEDSVKAAIKQTVKLFGKLNVIVNNAAPTEFITGSHEVDVRTKVDDIVTEVTTENWRKITLPSIDGLMWTLKYGIPPMQEAGGGSIVNISSTCSINGAGGVDAYTASKGAMNSLTLATAVNYQPFIRSNCLVAGPFRTPGLAPLLARPEFEKAFNDTVLTPKIGEPENMAMAVVFFASDESAFITGQILPVDGGFVVPVPMPTITQRVGAEA
jgi:NAD(P)-dependent dehydrogenase (short-subunit alcohol dehydrogenase family)